MYRTGLEFALVACFPGLSSDLPCHYRVTWWSLDCGWHWLLSPNLLSSSETAPHWRGHCPILSPMAPTHVSLWISTFLMVPWHSLLSHSSYKGSLQSSLLQISSGSLIPCSSREQSCPQALTWGWTIGLYNNNNIIVFSLVLKSFSNNS